jgi:hypothetical protein
MNPLTQREIMLCKSALDFLHALDGGQAIELEIHAALLRDAAVHPKPSACEVESAIRILSEKKWAVGVPARIGARMKWCSSDAGEAARLVM